MISAGRRGRPGGTFRLRREGEADRIRRMSTRRSSYPIACPRCGREFDATLYDVVDASDTPEAREELLSRRLNRVACPSGECGAAFAVDKPLVYRDPARGIFIHYEPVTERRGLEAIEKDFAAAAAKLAELIPGDVAAPALHLVTNASEMMERLFVLESGLDPRIVEQIKYMMYKANPEDLPARGKLLLFDPAGAAEAPAGNAVEEAPVANLRFIVQDVATGKLERVLGFARENYDALASVYAGDMAEVLEEWFPGPCINGRLRFLRDEANGELDEDDEFDDEGMRLE